MRGLPGSASDPAAVCGSGISAMRIHTFCRRLVGCTTMAAVALGLVACGPADPSRSPTATSAPTTETLPTDRTDPDIALIGTRWAVHSIVLPGLSAGPTVGVSPKAYLVFDGVGGFTGSTGCAEIRGTAVIASDRITMSVSDAPPCSGSDRSAHNTLLAVLDGDVGYDVNWLTLTLRGPDGTEVTLRASV